VKKVLNPGNLPAFAWFQSRVFFAQKRAAGATLFSYPGASGKKTPRGESPE
jgi:hypothetical protein